MARAAYGIRTTLTLGYAEAVERTKNALQEQGFGVLSEIDEADRLSAPGRERRARGSAKREIDGDCSAGSELNPKINRPARHFCLAGRLLRRSDPLIANCSLSSLDSRPAGRMRGADTP